MKAEISLSCSQIPPLIPVIDQKNLFQSLAADLFQTYYIRFPPTLRSSKLPLAFFHKNPICTSALVRAYYMPHLPHPLCFAQSNNVWLGAPIMKLSITQVSPVSCHCKTLRHIHKPQQLIPEHRRPLLVPGTQFQISDWLLK